MGQHRGAICLAQRIWARRMGARGAGEATAGSNRQMPGQMRETAFALPSREASAVVGSIGHAEDSGV
jgi:hypothetical protein